MKPALIPSTLMTALIACTAWGQDAAAPHMPTRYRGIVQSFDSQVINVTTPDQRTTAILVPPKLIIKANNKARLADIRVGDFVGSTSHAGPGGTLVADEVHLFPEFMRGTAEGHHEVGPARYMTNGTVTRLPDGSQRTMTFKIPADAPVSIEVPVTTPVYVLVAVDRSLIQPGKTATVIVAPRDGGGWVAVDMVVEKDGILPR